LYGGNVLNAVEVETLTKHYRVYLKPFDRLKEAVLRRPCHERVDALNNVSFTVPTGGTLGIIGENGAGKSTLLKILAGTATATRGRVEKRGRMAALLELGSGFHPEFSGRQNIYLNAALMGLKESEIRDREHSIVSFSELGGAIERPVKTYSSGMYVRLAFSIATSVDPDLLIIDEALSVGDHRFQQKCVERMIGFREAKKTIIICSHSMYLINELCTTAIWLKGGSVCSIGKASRVISEYLASVDGCEETAPVSQIKETPRQTDSAVPEITIEALCLMDENGLPIEHFRQFNRVVVQVKTLRAGLPLRGHLSVGIFYENGKRVFETTTKLAGTKSILFEGKQVTELVIPQIPITGGKYLVHVRLGDEHALRVIDELKSPPFLIESENPEMGTVWVEHFWKVPGQNIVQ
jgi:ABC-type polysaccharide/polyol phosphate transport system ATPase subunit